MAWRNCVGVEVHVQLKTESKMFCSCSADFGGEPNSRCCPVCLGLPGSLPVPNEQAIEFVIRTGLALNCQVAQRCRFARKNYFYPDLPKNYQISQYDEPLTFGGWIDLEVDGQPVRIRIRRAHLEEDTGKNIHLPDGRSVVDYNRCGVPLMEIVTEPDFTDAEQVRAYLQALRQLLRYLEVSDADMEKGQMRCEPTVNLVNDETGERTPKVEIKNLNSIRSVYEAVRYELARQREAVERGEPLYQETRRWDEANAVTTTMRRKETADDYMYFPDPDLVPVEPSREWVEQVRAALPELPAARRRRFIEEYGLPAYDAGVLTEEKAVADYFEAVAQACGDAKAASNWVMTEVLRYLKEQGIGIDEFPLPPSHIAQLIGLVREGTVSSTIAKEVFARACADGRSPREIVEQDGLAQISDAAALEGLVEEAIAANPRAVADFQAGKEKALGAIVGHVMRATKGQANPALVNEMVRKRVQEL
ncbi:MAG: Asp-tRNA(Asn)/Glu-tRNA(Gln) amidotransferase subunit GatB [Armatimonadetes bacterium]|nr:Asp-tRNA(Asn)/Glu-tRNA(Gln) amidotransferase subunit GatB [Armatimonadota bacterium]